ncbi:cysteine hydrolase family protein [Undibacterium sp. SXout20W]|uniref:cysteine hydrolase family protein n=1 Tax=Undibacterium sp. SXout20W TaxID=3413051 RepID=UPI003BF1985A
MKSALLVIDVQRGLFDPEPRPFEADTVISRINALAERARYAATPVIFVQHEASDSALEFGSESWQLEQNLIVEEGDVILRKTTPDSFLATSLAGLLAQWGTEQLLICGYASEFCVDTTTRRAAALGFPVILVADAHTTHDKDHAPASMIRAHHNATLSNIRSFGPAIKAIASEQIVFGLAM